MSEIECPLCRQNMTNDGSYYVCEWCGYKQRKIQSKSTYPLKEIRAMSNAELLTTYRAQCEQLIIECNSRRGETKRTTTNVARLEKELKKRLDIPDDYIVSMDDRI
ncbi:MAG: hypothetical protein J6O13_03185 [Selenomonas sp.]|nr:hypothetical protein [Selenomonas sp.]